MRSHHHDREDVLIMDTRHFDSLTKQLAQIPSRRHVLQVLAAALSVGSVAALGRANSAEARGVAGCALVRSAVRITETAAPASNAI